MCLCARNCKTLFDSPGCPTDDNRWSEKQSVNWWSIDSHTKAIHRLLSTGKRSRTQSSQHKDYTTLHVLVPLYLLVTRPKLYCCNVNQRSWTLRTFEILKLKVKLRSSSRNKSMLKLGFSRWLLTFRALKIGNLVSFGQMEINKCSKRRMTRYIFQLSDLQRQPIQVRERSRSDGSQKGNEK